MFLADRRVAMVRNPESALELPRPALPITLKRAATAVAVGTALQIAAGLAGKFLAHRVASAAARKLFTRRDSQRRPVTVVSESLFSRRTWIRRD